MTDSSAQHGAMKRQLERPPTAVDLRASVDKLVIVSLVTLFR
jgi:hypothetical protein